MATEVGEAKSPGSVKLICGVLAGRPQWLERAEEVMEARWGPVDLAGEVWPFHWSRYYEAQMGPGLLRRLYSFRDLIAPDAIADIKLASNGMERALAQELAGAPQRPVNLDPGYVTRAKLVLATTKDYSHRTYLRAGIYAEVTLRWRNGAFQPWDWTYPDYRSDAYREFFARVRNLYTRQLATD